MNFKTTYILFGILLGVLGLFLLMQLLRPTPNDKTAYVLPTLPRESGKGQEQEITTVEIDRRAPKPEQLVFVRQDRGWRLAKPNIRVNARQVQDMLGQLFRAAKEEKDVDMTSNLSQFGLETPNMVVTLKNSAGQEWKVNVGAKSSGDVNAMVYVTSSDRPKEPMAVRRSTIDGIFKDLKDFRSKELLTMDETGAQNATRAIKLEGKGGKLLSLKQAEDDRWRFEKPPYGEADDKGEEIPAGPRPEQTIRSGVRGLVELLAMLKVEADADFVADDVPEGNMAKYGLEKDKPDLMKIEVTVKPVGRVGSEGKEYTEILLIGKKVDGKDDKVYARLANENSVVQLPMKSLNRLIQVLDNPSSLRNRDLVNKEIVGDTDAISLTSDKGTVKLFRTEDGKIWRLADADGKKSSDADTLSVTSLLNALKTERLVQDFPKQSEKELGLDKPTAEVSLWVKADKAEKPKDPNAVPERKDAPRVKLTFGKEEKDLVYVRREVTPKKGDREVTLLAVPKKLLQDVSKGRLAFLERKLPDFPEADVTEMVLAREGEKTWKVKKETGKDNKTTWKVVEPETFKGRNADTTRIEDIIRAMRLLRPEEFITEKASDTDLARYGLTVPRVSVTITLKKGTDAKEEKRVYVFGKSVDKDANSNLYAKQGERDMVFVVSNSVLSEFKGELLDMTVFSFEQDKVKKLTLVGWGNLIPGSFTLELTREGAREWKVIKPEAKVLGAPNIDNIEKLVASLSKLRADKFLDRDAKGDFKLDVKKGTLEITVELEGNVKYVLTVGGENPDKKFYYAKSSNLPNDVFLLPLIFMGSEDPKTGAKSAPTYFKKE